MSVLFRRPPRDVARAGQPAFTFNDWVRIAGGSSSISQSSVQSIEQALTSSVVWRCAMKNAATRSAFWKTGDRLVSAPLNNLKGSRRSPHVGWATMSSSELICPAASRRS